MSYWEERQKELYKQLEEDEKKLKKRLSSYYSKQSQKLENNIAAYYTKYGENKVIEYRKMMEKLSNDDISLLMEQMDEFAIKYPQHAHLMPVRESIYKLNRLEGLQTSIKMQQLEIGAIDNDMLTEHLTKQAHRGVNASAEALGFGKNFYAINSDIVKSFVNVNFANGKNFSESIWGNTKKLANYLNTDIAQAMARGDSYERIMRNMKDRFETVSRNDMYRLVYTEGTHVMAESTIKPFEEDFERYKISTAEDGKVCSICRRISNQVFNIKDRVAGVNFPPFHPWCRCTFTIEVEDWDEWMDEYVQKHSGASQNNAKNVALKISQPSTSLKVNYDEIFNLSKDEVASIKRYIGSDSYKINDKLRRNVALNNSELEWITSLDNALDKMPEYKGDVVRVLDFYFKEDMDDFLNAIEIGGKINFNEYLSFSYNKGYNKTAQVSIFINSKTGKDISMYNWKEKEILFKRNTEFLIVDKKVTDNKVKIWMEE